MKKLGVLQKRGRPSRREMISGGGLAATGCLAAPAPRTWQRPTSFKDSRSEQSRSIRNSDMVRPPRFELATSFTQAGA